MSRLSTDVATDALDGVNTAITAVHDLMHAAKDCPEVLAVAQCADDVLRRLEQIVSRVSGVPIP